MTSQAGRPHIAVIDPSGYSLPYDVMLCNALVDRSSQLNETGFSIDVSLVTTADRSSDAWALPDPDFDYQPHYYGRWNTVSLPESIRLVLKAGEHIVDQANLISANKYDLYHIQWTPVATVDWLVLRLLGLKAPVVLTVHNVLPHESNFIDLVSRKFLYHSVGHLIVHTDRSKERLVERFDVHENKISVIPHGNFQYMREFDVDIESLPPHVKDLSERPTMLAFGLIREYKRIDVAIQALAIVQKKVPDAALLIAGDARTEMSQYHDLVAELGLESDVIFLTEYIPDELVPSIFAVADVCVFPYENIDQSGAALLAATLGKPIVASDIAGFRDIVLSEETGVLINQSPEELAGAVSRLLLDSTLCNQLGNAAAEHARNNFDWATIADTTLNLYRDII